jgi:radical SAM superfamily enzyme YgiQ (UPF0313 family)
MPNRPEVQVKVLVVNTNRERSPQTLLPLGACCVASAAEAAGHEVSFLDLTFPRDPLRALRRQLASRPPDVIGLSLRNLDNCDYTHPRSYLPEVRTMVEETRRCSGAEVVLGGPAVGQRPEALLRYLDCRLAVSGEGELAFSALLAVLETGGDPATVPGVTMLEGAQVRSAPVAAALDPGALPRVRSERWLALPRYRAYETAWPLQTKRGCAFHCTYCVYPLLEGPGWRLHEPETVAEEVQRGRQLGFRLAEIVDSVWGFPPEHALACCEAIAARTRRLPLCAMELNPAAVSPELVRGMNAAGFTAVGISAESGSDRMLSTLGKKYTAEDLRRAERESRALRAQRMWVFLLGAPGENEQSLRETARFIGALPRTDLVFLTYGVRLLPGTALAQELVRSGELDRADTLMWPRFYWSPEVSLERAQRLMAESGFPPGNVVALSDGLHRLLPLVQRLATFCHLPPPYWRHGRRLQRLRRALHL